MTRTERDHIEYFLARLEKSVQKAAEVAADFRKWLDGFPLPPAPSPPRHETQGDFDAPHQLAAEAERIEEAEALVRQHPRVTQPDFDALHAIAAEAERIGEKEVARRARLETIERREG